MLFTLQKNFQYFNPRSPHGERPRKILTASFGCIISIHAPRTGSDECGKKAQETQKAFQSTLPARGATPAFPTFAVSALFQSTLPARGATSAYCYQIPTQLYFNPRSPHGERLNRACPSTVRAKFQSTLPARGATERQGGILQYFLISIHAPRTGSDITNRTPLHNFAISIHAPRTGSDCINPYINTMQPISIHAPRTGSDGIWTENVPMALHFNPRSPHGERRYLGECLNATNDFNPRSPHGERHASSIIRLIRADFNPRSPHGERRPDSASLA